jgi:preprotein translocase SecF subunit
MIDLVSKRFIFLGVSLLIIIPGLIAILTGGLKPGIDFTGGTRLTVIPAKQDATAQQFRDALASAGHGDTLVKGGTIGEGTNITNTITMDIPGIAELPDAQREEERSEIARALIQAGLVPGSEQDVSVTVPTTPTTTITPTATLSQSAITTTVTVTSSAQLTGTAVTTGTTGSTTPTTPPVAARTETVRRWLISEQAVIDDITVGPTVGRELVGRAFLAIMLASVAILLYLTLVFRKVPNAFRYGVCAIIALLHDVLVVLGLFAILGHAFGTEIDALFITAVLTVIGFSVHDTIVVFDRVRENITRRRFDRFEDVVNYSLVQTLARSINTSITVILTLFALYLFGGASIRNFVLVLLIGIISGTYSSIFNASMLLVIWEKGEWRGPRREALPATPAPRGAR